MEQTTANTTNIAKQTAFAKCKIFGFDEEKIETGEGECTVFTDSNSRTRVILMPDDAEQTVLSLSFGEEVWSILIVK